MITKRTPKCEEDFA